MPYLARRLKCIVRRSGTRESSGRAAFGIKPGFHRNARPPSAREAVRPNAEQHLSDIRTTSPHQHPDPERQP